MHNIGEAEMRILAWVFGHKRIDRIKNDDIQKKFGVALI